MEITYIEAAKKWWEKILFQKNGTKFDNGDEESGALIMLLAGLLNDSYVITDEELDAFTDELEKTIKEEIQKNGRLSLTSDYHPEGLLAEIVKKSGIPEAKVPYKTEMIITEDIVKVSCGYGKPFEVIFKSNK